jgi:hypothetical protein
VGPRPGFKVKPIWAWIVVALAVIAFLAVTNRYSYTVVNASGGVFVEKIDRWTGEHWMCTAMDGFCF